MKYYKLNDIVYAFELDGSQDDYITEDMQLMSEEEVDRHINPNKYLTKEEADALYLSQLPPLSRRQFKLILLEHDLLATVEETINAIADAKLKTRIQIEYAEATQFVRTSESVIYMLNLLGLSEAEVNTIWEEALKL